MTRRSIQANAAARPTLARLLDAFLRRAAATAPAARRAPATPAWAGLETLDPRTLMSVASQTYLDASDQASEAVLVDAFADAWSYDNDILAGTDVDVYRLTVAAGTQLTFDIDTDGSGLNSLLRLFNSAGKAIAGNDNSTVPDELGTTDSCLRYNFGRGGTYFIAVSASGNNAYNLLKGTGDKTAATVGGYTLAITNTTPDDNAGNGLTTARDLGTVSGSSSYSDFVGAVDVNDFYKLTLDSLTRLTATVTDLTGAADLQLIKDKNNNGVIDKTDLLAYSRRAGLADDTIDTQLAAGTYFLRVLGGGEANYTLNLAAVETPEVTVTGNNVNINTGDTTPAAADFTAFGLIAIGDDPVTRTFTVTNDGSDTLTLSNLVVPDGFTVIDGLSASLESGESDTFTIKLETDTLGVKVGNVSFTTNDWNETTFNFRVSGVVTPVDNAGNNTYLARDHGALSDETTYQDFVGGVDTADYYKFTLAGMSIFSSTLTNLTSDANLELIFDKNSNGRIDRGESIALSKRTGANAEAITRQLTAGTYYLRVVRYKGDTSYDLTLAATPTPEITVTGNGRNINDNATKPSLTDHTHFGVIFHNADAVTRTFTIRNDGAADLTIDSVVIPAGFTLVGGPADTLAAGASATLTVRMDSDAIGVKSGQIVITCNDVNESTFNFSIIGAVSALPPEATLLYNGVEIADGDLTAALADGTDFGTAALGGDAVTRTFTLRNDGEAALKVSKLKLPAGWELVEGISPVINGGASDTFTLRMKVLTLGQLGGQVSFVTNDANEALYNFAVSGAVTGAADGGNDWFDQNLYKANVRQVARAKFADDVIDRADMIDILNAAAADDGRIDSNELHDLRAIVTGHDTLNMADHVYVLAGNVVNSNVANAKYQGTTLGNLAVGSTGGQLTKLINKWFYGLDRPNAGSYAYRQFAGQLFVNGATTQDVNQGYVGDCYYLAALGSVAGIDAQAIEDMFIDNGDGTYTVRFFKGSDARYVTVDLFLPTNASGYAVFAEVGAHYTNAGAELWVALAEKAYAQINEEGWIQQNGVNAYEGISGGLPNVATSHITGKSSAWYGIPALNTVVDWLNNGLAVTLGTKTTAGSGWVGGHAYIVTGYDANTQTFTLYNPWGYSHLNSVTYAAIQANCNNFFTAVV